jgi:hypothetical protein
MNHEEKQIYLQAIKRRYQRALKREKRVILDEFAQVCGYHRKSAIRLLRKRPKRKHSSVCRRGRPRYDRERILPVLKCIWFASDQICSKKLQVALREWLPHYVPALDDDIVGQLLSISPATIDRLLKPIRIKHKGKGLSGTKPGRLLKNQIPIKTDHWDVTQPGFMEADTVAHCGNSLTGDFVWSITFTDIYSTWTENRAVWNKGAHGVVTQTKDMEKRLPFELLGFDCDNGSEFLNYHLLNYFRKRSKVVQFTRSRPYHKNDNAHVEQKNWTHVRHLFGYDRFENHAMVALMNDLYCNEWSLYQNHFIPTMKLVEKKKINSRYYKRYDKPQTPYQRLMSCEHISAEREESLRVQHEALNPFILKEIIEKKLADIFKYVTLTSHVRHRL